MSRIDSINKVREYPDEVGPYHTMIIMNHWNHRDRVVIEINGKKYTFIARDLKLAIDNAVNCHGY